MLNRIGRRIGKAILLLLCVALWFAGGAVASSVLQVYQGGTGASSLSAHGAAIINSTGTAITTIAPGSNGNTLQSNGTDWISAASSGGISREAWVSGCRLTIDTSTDPLPYPTSELRNKTMLHLVPAVSNLIWCYDNSTTWTQHIVPLTGVNITNSGLSSSTTYNAYCYNNSGTMAIDLSTTGTVIQDGVEVKSGATNETFVGCVRTDINNPGQFWDASNSRYVANWYNAIPHVVQYVDSASHSTNSATYVQIGGIECDFVVAIPQYVTWSMSFQYVSINANSAGGSLEIATSATGGGLASVCSISTSSSGNAFSPYIQGDENYVSQGSYINRFGCFVSNSTGYSITATSGILTTKVLQ